MSNKLNLVIAIAFTVSFSAARAEHNPEHTAVQAACSQEIATAGCGGEKLGHGLLKCVRSYKKAHADFKLSESCQKAVDEVKANRKARKAK
jgi:hypothetical protein